MRTTCCIAGGGPAGIMLGFLLARAGIDVVVLEKHKDFLRDFRGDTVHPSTLELMFELGLLEEFLHEPHQQLPEIKGMIDGFPIRVADFSYLPSQCKFIALMPQWNFLNFLTQKASHYPGFRLLMETEAQDLIVENNIIRGVRAKGPEGELEIFADLTVATDGRHSMLREKAGLKVLDLGAPIDVLWMRLSRKPNDPDYTLGNYRSGKILITLNRGDYWQCAYIIAKGGFEAIQERGLPSFRADIEAVAPFFQGRTAELAQWSDIKLLSVSVDRLQTWWRSGLLCIGDAAHAMSPMGGVGINLAIQDAVAAANILALPLAQRRVSDKHLQQIQTRREFPTRMTQALQVFLHNYLIEPALKRTEPFIRLPFFFRLMQRFSWLRRIPARSVGIGFRPEHIHTPDSNAHNPI